VGLVQHPHNLKRHLSCPIVDELTPITQKHSIEGLMMGEAQAVALYGLFSAR
jgi:hypothetical protein